MQLRRCIESWYSVDGTAASERIPSPGSPDANMQFRIRIRFQYQFRGWMLQGSLHRQISTLSHIRQNTQYTPSTLVCRERRKIKRAQPVRTDRHSYAPVTLSRQRCALCTCVERKLNWDFLESAYDIKSAEDWASTKAFPMHFPVHLFRCVYHRVLHFNFVGILHYYLFAFSISAYIRESIESMP